MRMRKQVCFGVIIKGKSSKYCYEPFSFYIQFSFRDLLPWIAEKQKLRGPHGSVKDIYRRQVLPPASDYSTRLKSSVEAFCPNLNCLDFNCRTHSTSNALSISHFANIIYWGEVRGSEGKPIQEEGAKNKHWLIERGGNCMRWQVLLMLLRW